MQIVEGTASVWYDSVEEFQQLLLDAISQARQERAQEFSHEMMARSKADGLYAQLSERQLRWLCTIADHVPPKRRKEA